MTADREALAKLLCPTAWDDQYSHIHDMARNAAFQIADRVLAAGFRLSAEAEIDVLSEQLTGECNQNADLKAKLAAYEAVVVALLGHWRAFKSRGNQEDAYYCLAKGAQETWKCAEHLVSGEEQEKQNG